MEQIGEAAIKKKDSPSVRLFFLKD